MAVSSNRTRRSASRHITSSPGTKHKSRKPPQAQPPYRPSRRKGSFGRSVQFPEIKGRTVETIEFYTSPDYHCISVSFRDKTSLDLEIDPVPGFTVSAIHQQWKAGNSRVLRRWPAIPSDT